MREHAGVCSCFTCVQETSLYWHTCYYCHQPWYDYLHLHKYFSQYSKSGESLNYGFFPSSCIPVFQFCRCVSLLVWLMLIKCLILKSFNRALLIHTGLPDFALVFKVLQNTSAESACPMWTSKVLLTPFRVKHWIRSALLVVSDPGTVLCSAGTEHS